jgi:fatty-acyl-CoA synthase
MPNQLVDNENCAEGETHARSYDEHAAADLSLIRHADRYHADTEIVSRLVEGGIHRYNYSEAHRRARQLANALGALKVRMTDRIGTLAWNGFRHFEIYYAVSGSGAVCHTINPRLFPEQVAYIINHAADQYVFVDLTFVPLVEKLAEHSPHVKGWVLMTDRRITDQALSVFCYETGRASPDAFDWPVFDENTASSLPIGDDGQPQGRALPHCSTVLHYAHACRMCRTCRPAMW